MNTNGHELETAQALKEEWGFGAAKSPKLLLKEELFQIVGAAMEVLFVFIRVHSWFKENDDHRR